MTPTQLKESTTKELLIAYKNKARCYHSIHKSNAIYHELAKRLGSERLNGIRLGAWHMQNGEGDSEFNQECNKLISQF